MNDHYRWLPGKCVKLCGLSVLDMQVFVSMSGRSLASQALLTSTPTMGRTDVPLAMRDNLRKSEEGTEETTQFRLLECEFTMKRVAEIASQYDPSCDQSICNINI